MHYAEPQLATICSRHLRVLRQRRADSGRIAEDRIGTDRIRQFGPQGDRIAIETKHEWRGERLWRVDVTGGGKRAGDPVAFLEGDYGRIRTVVTAPDGSLWITTSNQDGRGTPAGPDDRILRVRP